MHGTYSPALFPKYCRILHIILSIYSLSEFPDLHLKIACNDECMDQLSCLILTPSLDISSVHYVSGTFVSIAYTPETHIYLAKPHYIEQLLKGCSRDWQFSENDEMKDLLLLK